MYKNNGLLRRNVLFFLHLHDNRNITAHPAVHSGSESLLVGADPLAFHQFPKRYRLLAPNCVHCLASFSVYLIPVSPLVNTQAVTLAEECSFVRVTLSRCQYIDYRIG